MQTSLPALRTLRALTIALVVLASAASTVAAGGSSRPIPGHHPRFVTEREAGRWQDCLWASGAMLVDKWTAGRVMISKDDLRKLSGDRAGGSDIGHLALALSRLGLTARPSPNGGSVITWATLKARLAAGGGAILLGDDSRLPRWYGRWDAQFWNNRGSKDDHAVYLDRYDRAHDRFWIMDPLAPPDWTGEWISGRDLRAFAWSARGGALFGLMTPAAARPSFAGVRFRGPVAFAGVDGLHVGWSIARTPKHWARPGVTAVVSVTAATQLLPLPHDLVLGAPPVAVSPGVQALPGPRHGATVRLGDRTLNAIVPYPAASGTYRVGVTVRDRHSRRNVATSAFLLYVPGERRATIVAAPPSEPIPVGSFELSADVTNSGWVSWAEAPQLPGVPQAVSIPRKTRLVATWLPIGAGAAATGPASAVAKPVGPIPVILDALPLAPGEFALVAANIATPVTPGRWALILDIVDDIDGSFALHGSRPTTIVVDIVEPIAGQPPRN